MPRLIAALRSLPPSRRPAGGRLWVGALLALLVGGIAPAAAATLRISVEGVRNSRGNVLLCLFTAPRGFPDCSNAAGAIRRTQAASAGTTEFVLDVPPGVLAASVLHDESGSGHPDVNFLGIPLAGLGASNNPRARFGPPRYADAAFTLPPDGGAIVIRLVYP